MKTPALAIALLGALAPTALLVACGGSSVVDQAPARSSPLITVLDEAGGTVPDAEVWIVDRLKLRAEVAVVQSRMTGDWVETSRQIATEIQRADGDGRARFELVPESGVLIAAQKGALFGGVELGALGDGEIELRLRPRPGYRVRVVDAEGQPAPGVPMSLAIPRGEDLERLAATAFTGEDGVAVIYEPPSAAFDSRRGERGTERVAVARIPTRDLLQVRVDPVGTAEVRLPPTGSVALSVKHPAFSADHWRGVIQLFAAKDGSRSEITLAAPLIDSRVVVPYVEVGVDLRVVVVLAEKTDASRRLVGTAAERIGPIRNVGEEKTHVVLLDGGALFEGRLVDSEGEPIAKLVIHVRIENEPSTSWTVVTDDDGGFRWLLTASRGVLDGAVIEFGGRPRAATATIPKVVPGETISLGTIRLPTGPR